MPSEPRADAPTAGDSLKVTLDLGLEQEGEKALLEGIERARRRQTGDRRARSWRWTRATAQCYAMGSFPTLRPEQVRQPLTKRNTRRSRARRRLGDEAPAPLINRAINGIYPTGSTFKPITALAALEAGVITPTETLGGGHVHRTSATEQFCNAGNADYGDRRTRRSAEGLRGHLLLPRRRARQRPRQRRSRTRRASSASASRPASTCRARSPASSPIAAWRAKRRTQLRARVRARRARTARPAAIVAEPGGSLDGRRQHPAGGRPGRPADRRRCRWPSPTRRSPTRIINGGNGRS